MCLASPSVGDFKPITLSEVYPNGGKNSPITDDSSNSVSRGQQHIPGKAGGGWEGNGQNENKDADLAYSQLIQLEKLSLDNR